MHDENAHIFPAETTCVACGCEEGSTVADDPCSGAGSLDVIADGVMTPGPIPGLGTHGGPITLFSDLLQYCLMPVDDATARTIEERHPNHAAVVCKGEVIVAPPGGHCHFRITSGTVARHVGPPFENLIDHPDGWEGACLCYECMILAASDSDGGEG